MAEPDTLSGSQTPPSADIRWTYAFGALGGFLFGYDTGVIAGALLFIRQEMHLDPLMQGVVVSSLLVGAMIGAATSGHLSNRVGPRRLLMAAGLILAAGSLGAALAPGAATLTAFRVVIGIGVGIASAQVPLYLSEIAPTRIRGGLSTLNQIMIAIGVLTAYLVSYALAGQGAWRLMVGIAILPALLLIWGMARQPESPRWLFRQGRVTEAAAVLRRNRGDAETEAELAGMRTASRHEQLDLRQLLRAPWLHRPLMLAGGLAILQQVVGINTIVYYAPTIFQAAGFTSSSAIFLTLALSGMTLGVTVLTARMVDRIGRRRLMLGGALTMAVTMACLGTIFFTDGLTSSGGVTLAVLCIGLYKVAFSFSWGPLVWVLLPEVLPLQGRGQAMGVATMLNWLSNFVVALTFPLLLAVGAGAVFELFACCALFAFVFAHRHLHETAGRSLEQIELDATPSLAE